MQADYLNCMDTCAATAAAVFVFLCSLCRLPFPYLIKRIVILSLCSKQEVYSSDHYSEYFSLSLNIRACAYLASALFFFHLAFALKTDFLSCFPPTFCTPELVNCHLSPL